MSVSMTGGLSYWIKSLGLMAILGVSLGGMGSYWYFFWENREMCPCAPAGLEGGDDLNSAVVQPYSEVLMRNRVISFSFSGGLVGIVVGLFASVPRVRRFKKVMKDISIFDEEP